MRLGPSLEAGPGDEAEAVEERPPRMVLLRGILVHQVREGGHAYSSSVGQEVRGIVSMLSMVRFPAPKVQNRL